MDVAVAYSLRLLRCTGTTADTCTVEADTKPDMGTAGEHIFKDVTPGLFLIDVSSTAANGVASDRAATPLLLVGRPGRAQWVISGAAQGGVGEATLAWLSPALNPDPTGVVDGTKYTLKVYTPDGATLVKTLQLTDPSGQGSEAEPFTKLVTLLAGARGRRMWWAVAEVTCTALQHLHCSTARFFPPRPACAPTSSHPPGCFGVSPPPRRRQVAGHRHRLQCARQGPGVGAE